MGHRMTTASTPAVVGVERRLEWAGAGGGTAARQQFRDGPVRMAERVVGARGGRVRKPALPRTPAVAACGPPGRMRGGRACRYSWPVQGLSPSAAAHSTARSAATRARSLMEPSRGRSSHRRYPWPALRSLRVLVRRGRGRRRKKLGGHRAAGSHAPIRAGTDTHAQRGAAGHRSRCRAAGWRQRVHDRTVARRLIARRASAARAAAEAPGAARTRLAQRETRHRASPPRARPAPDLCCDSIPAPAPCCPGTSAQHARSQPQCTAAHVITILNAPGSACGWSVRCRHYGPAPAAAGGAPIHARPPPS